MRIATPTGDREVRSIEDPTVQLTGLQLSQHLGLSESTPWGRNVNAESAVNGTVGVYACVSLLAEVMGSLPLKLYRRDSKDHREEITSATAAQGLVGRGYPGSLARVLGELPNTEMTAQDLWTTVFGCAALYGNAYLQIVRDGSGRVAELWPLRPDKMEVYRADAKDAERLGIRAGEKFYIYRLQNGQTKHLSVREVMHYKWFGTDGLVGLSPITVARNLIAGDQAQGDYQGQFYSNNAMPSSIVTIPKRGANEFGNRAQTYREHMENLYGGAANRGKIAVLEEGVTWQAVQMSMKDMEFIQTHKWNITQLCQLWRIPAYIMDPEKTSSWGSGVEQQFLGLLTMTLRPKLEGLENTINRSLGLVLGERTLLDEKIYPEFEVDALLRPDSKSRWAAYTAASQLRVLNPAQIAAIENIPFDPERPTDYVNPNTSSDAPAAPDQAEPAQLQAAAAPLELEARDEDTRTDALLAAVSNMTQMHAADMQMLSEVKRAELVGQPDFNITVPEAIVQLPPEMRLAAPEVTIDTKPFADALTVAIARFAELDARADERDRQLREALTPKATKRVIERDEHSNIIAIREVADEEAV